MRLIFIVLGIAISFFLGYFVKERVTPGVSITGGRQIRQGGYSFINPLLECDIGEKTLSTQLTSFKYKVEKAISDLESSGSMSDMSLYFRDLNNGVGFGINEKEAFSPASLLKLPVMIAYLKASESDPSILKKKLTYNEPDRNIGETIKPENHLKPGNQYLVEELVERMVVGSDNNAMALLVGNMPLTTQDKVYRDLGITIPGVRGLDDYMSVTENAAFFRVLYNASYLSKDSSEKALKLLAKVDFDKGIRAGVPKDIPVSNKFGERTMNGKQQLHDCGIVYYNDHPYLLCVMSRGSNFDSLAKSISTISSLVYQEVDRQIKNPQN